jgi:hypothetical protein
LEAGVETPAILPSAASQLPEAWARTMIFPAVTVSRWKTWYSRGESSVTAPQAVSAMSENTAIAARATGA